MSAPISAFIVTLNEAKHLAATLASLQGVEEVIVVDSGSTDGTIEIARAHGATVIHQDWLGFAAQKAFALAQCRHEWCLNLDGDEVLPPGMLAEVRSLIERGDCDGLRFRIEDLFMGAPMHPWSRKRHIIRCFKKSAVAYPSDRRVHENVVCRGKVVTTQQALVHYGYNDLETFMAKYNRYAALKAADKFEQGKGASLLKLLFIFPLSFLKVYCLRGLLLSGRRGLIQAYLESMYALLKEANLYQLQRTARRCD